MATVTLDLTVEQCAHLARLCASAAHKHDRRFVASTFEPAPGKRHADQVAAERWRALERIFLDAAQPRAVRSVPTPTQGEPA